MRNQPAYHRLHERTLELIPVDQYRGFLSFVTEEAEGQGEQALRIRQAHPQGSRTQNRYDYDIVVTVRK